LLFALFFKVCAILCANGFDGQIIFKAGEDGYHTYRIPALCLAKDGALLAFSEGRKNSVSDTGHIDIVMRRSLDGGKTWGDLSVVISDGNTCGNPAPVLDENSGDIVLVYSRNLAEDFEANIIKGLSKDTRRVFVTRSVDNGLTWSRPQEITQAVKPAAATWFASGPGGGIQLKGGKFGGRLLVPFNIVADGANRAGALISDDGGKTWRAGAMQKDSVVDESEIAQLAADTVVINSRAKRKGASKEPFRKTAISFDGGETWGTTVLEDELAEPVCDGSLISFLNDGSERILCFSNPANTQYRADLTVRFAKAESVLKWFKNGAPRNDCAKRWQTAALFDKYPRTMYSALAYLGGGNVGLIYEYGAAQEGAPAKNIYEGIKFCKISVPSAASK